MQVADCSEEFSGVIRGHEIQDGGQSPAPMGKFFYDLKIMRRKLTEQKLIRINY